MLLSNLRHSGVYLPLFHNFWNELQYLQCLLSQRYGLIGMPRETREGCPLVTVETELNRDSKSTNERGPSLVGSLGLSCHYKRFLYALAALVGSVQNIIFLTVHYFNHFPPAGQAAVLGRLSFSMCLWACQRMIQNRSSELYI